jgi:hypothetical protein
MGAGFRVFGSSLRIYILFCRITCITSIEHNLSGGEDAFGIHIGWAYWVW